MIPDTLETSVDFPSLCKMGCAHMVILLKDVERAQGMGNLANKGFLQEL